MMPTEVRPRFTPALALWTAWAAVLLGACYQPLWRLVAGDTAVLESLFPRGAEQYIPTILVVLVCLAIAAAGTRFGRRGERRAALPAWVAAGGAGLLFAFVLAPAGFPAFGEAAPRALRGIGGCAAVLAAAQGPGWAALRLAGALRLDAAESLLFRTAAGLGILAYLALAMAAVNLYNLFAIRTLVAALLPAGAVLLVRSAREFRAGEPPAVSVAPKGDAGDGIAWKTAALLFLLIAFVGALAPESEYDALWYHLNLPRMWLERGTIIDFPSEYVSLYPMTWELLYGTGMAVGGPVAAKLLHFSALPLLALLAYRMTRRFFPATAPWPAVAFFVTMPTVLWEATTAYVDLALGLHAGLALYALLRFAESEERPWLLLAALQMGFALATKHLAFFVLLPAAAGLGIFLLRRGPWLRAAGYVSVFAAFSLLVAVPWYARSFAATGNPVFPELFGLFGGPPDRWDAVTDAGLDRFKEHFGRPRTFLNLITLPWDATVHAARYGGSLGPMFLLLLPGLLLPPSEASARRIGFAVLAFAALWASPFSSFQMRFLVPAASAMAVLAGVAYGRLHSLAKAAGPGWGEKALSIGIPVLLLMNLPPLMPLQEVDRAGWKGWLTHVVRRVPAGVVAGSVSSDEYLASTIGTYSAWRYMNESLPGDARVLTFVQGDNLYADRERLWIYAVVARPAVWGAPIGAESKALDELRRLEITHILFERKELETLSPGSVAIVGEGFRRAWLVPEYADGNAELHRIRYGNGTGNRGGETEPARGHPIHQDEEHPR